MKESLISIGMKFLKQKYPLLGATAIITNSKKEVLLGKRSSNHPFYADYWGLPGGLIEFGEEPKQAAKREVKEEMRIDIEVNEFVGRYYQTFPNKYTPVHTISLPFKCKIIRGIPKPGDETQEIKWFKPSEIRRMKLAFSHKQMLEDEGLA